MSVNRIGIHFDINKKLKYSLSTKNIVLSVKFEIQNKIIKK